MSFVCARSIRAQPRVVTPVSAKKPSQGKTLSSIVNFKTNKVIVNTTLRAFHRYKSDQKGPTKPPQQQPPQKTAQQPQKPQGGQASQKPAQGGQQVPSKGVSTPPQKNPLTAPPAARQDLIVNNAPRDPVRLQGEMKQLIEQEVLALESESKDPFIEEFLRVSQFEVVPRKPEELYKLAKTMDNYKIEVAFSTEPPMPDSDGQQYSMDDLDEDLDEEGEGASNATGRAAKNRFNEDEDEDEDVEEGEEEDEENPWVTPISVSVKVQFLDPQTKNAKGTWELECLAGEEERLFVEQMKVTDVNGNLVSQTLFDGLSQPVQDKVYDMLDEIGVDDNLAKFVQHALVDELRTDEINFLRTFKGMLL